MHRQAHFVAAGIEVQIEFAGIEDRYKSRVVGFESGRFLILKTPAGLSGADERGFLAAGAELVARYLLGGTVWGFRTRILRQVNDDLGLLFVEYPEQMENYDLRHAKRVETRIPCKLRQGETEVDGLVLDLSETGARVVCRLPQELRWDPGSEIELEFPTLVSNGPTVLTSLVRSVREMGGRCTLGLQFQDSDKKWRAQIEEYLKTIREFTLDEAAD